MLAGQDVEPRIGFRPANVPALTSFNRSLFSAQATKVKRKYQAIVTGKSSGGSEKPSDKKFPQRSKKLPFKVRFNMESGGAKQVEQNRKATADETVAAAGNAPKEPKPTTAKAPAVTCPNLACLAFRLGHFFFQNWSSTMAYLILDPAAPGSIPGVPPKKLYEKLLLILINGAA